MLLLLTVIALLALVLLDAVPAAMDRMPTRSITIGIAAIDITIWIALAITAALPPLILTLAIAATVIEAWMMVVGVLASMRDQEIAEAVEAEMMEGAGAPPEPDRQRAAREAAASWANVW